MEDKLTVSVVNFIADWGDPGRNLGRMLEIADKAGRAGTDILVFPETALTGYDDAPAESREEKMHRRLAETVPGPASLAMAEVCGKYGMYAVFGLPEREGGRVYNSAAVCGPEGVIGAARKIHLPFSEMNWADGGDEPFLFETPWGPVGVSICYDTYAFPEVTRYFRAMGARLILNVSAIGTSASGGAGAYAGNIPLAYHAQNNSVFIATANLTGKERQTVFMGGANVIGPAAVPPEVMYYAGAPFSEEACSPESVETAGIDLSVTDVSFLATVFTGDGWKPDTYAGWLLKAAAARARRTKGGEKA